MNRERHLYLIGIGGSGMAWIADYALAQGWSLSGTDAAASTQVERLRSAGAVIHIGAQPSLIPDGITEAVISSAITPSSPHAGELEELLRRGVPVRKRAEWIGAITRVKRTIAVCGAHGKTTVTAMIGWILDQASFEPTVFTGSTVRPWGDGTRIGAGEWLVIEADEYDRSFHRFSAEIAVVLNIDLDHTEYYTGGLPEIERSYRRFLRNLPHRRGVLIGYGKDGRVRKLARGFKYKLRWYDETKPWPGVTVPQPGVKYRLNATAAARAAHEAGVPQKIIQSALRSFPGTARRFEYLGHWNQVELYDDYAHHPAELAALMQGACERWKQEELTLVFQPHQKARTAALLSGFGRAFDQNPPARLVLAPVYAVPGREDGSEVSSTDVAAEIAKRAPAGMTVEVARDEAELERLVRGASTAPGVLLIAGAGPISGMVREWSGR